MIICSLFTMKLYYCYRFVNFLSIIAPVFLSQFIITRFSGILYVIHTCVVIIKIIKKLCKTTVLFPHTKLAALQQKIIVINDKCQIVLNHANSQNFTNLHDNNAWFSEDFF